MLHDLLFIITLYVEYVWWVQTIVKCKSGICAKRRLRICLIGEMFSRSGRNVSKSADLGALWIKNEVEIRENFARHAILRCPKQNEREQNNTFIPAETFEILTRPVHTSHFAHTYRSTYTHTYARNSNTKTAWVQTRERAFVGKFAVCLFWASLPHVLYSFLLTSSPYALYS